MDRAVAVLNARTRNVEVSVGRSERIQAPASIGTILIVEIACVSQMPCALGFGDARSVSNHLSRFAGRKKANQKS